MPYRILILGASYGSLLGTKLAMAGHDATLLCRTGTAALINDEGTEVRIQLKGEDTHRSVFSRDLPGRVDANTPEAADPAEYDLVCLAMQEPQYSDPALRNLLNRTAKASVPCMSIMNMPPLPFLKRLPGLDCSKLEDAFTDPRVWDRFDPALMTLCSPDPQAFRPPEEKANVLQVGLPTNFKVARFDNPDHNRLLAELEADIDAVRLDGNDVPVKLRLHDSLYVPLAKWSMLATGNYRCITAGDPVSIRDAVHRDLDLSREIYAFVNKIVVALGGSDDDAVPFEKYAKAAENLLNPSSAARAVAGGSTSIERVDKLVQRVGLSLGMEHPALNDTVTTVDRKLEANAVKSAA